MIRIITATLAVLLILTGFGCQKKIVTETENINQTSNINESTNLNINTGTQTGGLDEETNTRNEVIQLARAFVERYGSFSNETNYQNILNLKILMTDKLAAWADSFVASQRSKAVKSDSYYGITTKSLAVSVVSFDSKTKAELKISTQRREADEKTASSKVFYQDIYVKIVKEAGDWKVDELSWQ